MALCTIAHRGEERYGGASEEVPVEVGTGTVSSPHADGAVTIPEGSAPVLMDMSAPYRNHLGTPASEETSVSAKRQLKLKLVWKKFADEAREFESDHYED